jgi:hypothetical protein
MIAKMSSSNTLYGALAYNQNKVDDAHAKVIFANRMIEPADGFYDISVRLRSFEHDRIMMDNVKKVSEKLWGGVERRCAFEKRQN